MKSGIKSTRISRADQAAWGFAGMASVDNPKASKATAYGYLNAILYMVDKDLCPHAGACAVLCLGEESGHAAIGAKETNTVIAARKARARAYRGNRQAFMRYVVKDITRLRRLARAMGLKLVYRFNGSTDVGVPAWLLEMFCDVDFIDYTKNPNKMAAYLRGDFAPNYHVTFSLDRGTASVPSNERLAERFLAAGGNVAVVGDPEGLGEVLRAAPRVDGDKHDIRTPAMDGRGNVIVLTPKGRKAKASTNGFVIRVAA